LVSQDFYLSALGDLKFVLVLVFTVQNVH
jgi:hypothetical protein